MNGDTLFLLLTLLNALNVNVNGWQEGGEEGEDVETECSAADGARG